jgi:hypothetical protein
MDWGKQARKPGDAGAGGSAFVKPTGEVAGKAASRPSPAPPTRADQLREEMNQAALDTQAAFDLMNAKGGQQAEKEVPVEAARSRPQSRAKSGRQEPLPSLSLEDVVPTAAAPVATNPPSQASPPAANRPASVPDPTLAQVADRTPEQRKADAVSELSQQLKPDIAAARQPLRAAMPLFGLESISPGAGHEGLDAVRGAVSADQRRAIGAVEDLCKLFTLDPNLAAADPGAVANAMRAQADRLVGQPQTDGQDLSLGAVAICQQVDGFGRYTPLRSNAFLAGRTGSMVLYSEVEHFSQTPMDIDEEGARWSVELGQSVKLFLDSDGSEQMSIPETIVKDVARAKRHDFFLVQRIDLPRTLSVGNYTLKVTVRDVASGGVVEQLTPIRVIADSSVARERSGPVSKQRGSERVTDRRP